MFYSMTLLQMSLQRSALLRWRFQPLLGNVMKRTDTLLFMRFVWAALPLRAAIDRGLSHVRLVQKRTF
jgi:hypothetical protein